MSKAQRRELEHQADVIEGVLHDHQISARVTGGTVTPRWVRFKARLVLGDVTPGLPALGAKISQIKRLDEELATALGVDNCRIQRRGAYVEAEIARDDADPVRLLSLYRQLAEGSLAIDIPSMTAILGLADDGAPLLIRLPSPDVTHISIAGGDGAGRTTLLQSIALSLVLENDEDQFRMPIIAPQGSEQFAPPHGVAAYPVCHS